MSDKLYLSPNSNDMMWNKLLAFELNVIRSPHPIQIRFKPKAIHQSFRSPEAIIPRGNVPGIELCEDPAWIRQYASIIQLTNVLQLFSLTECPIFNFEHGAADWSRQGSAFAHQPIFGGSSNSGHQGNWLIDSYRNVTTPCQRQNSSLGEQATGTMTSPPFVIRSATLSFLIGGKECFKL